jgi:histone H3/H4
MEDLLLPVLESAVVLASHYCKASGRSTVTATDIEYALKASIRKVAGNQIGSLFPEVYEGSDSGSDVEVVDDSDEPFTRYEGSDATMCMVNECYDTWEQWEPETPLERILKNSADRQSQHGR